MCVVQLKGGAAWPCVTAEHFDVIAKSSAFWNKREVAATLALDLSGGTGATYLVPSTFHAEEAGEFWLSLRSDVALDGFEWMGTQAMPSALWKGASARNTVRLGVGGATAGGLCVFVRQTSTDGQETRAEAQRVPLGVYLLDGDTVLQTAQFCRAGEVSVAFELDEERAASPHLAIAPCTFAADKGAQLEVELVSPDAPQAALALSASSGVDPRTLTATASKGAARPAGKGKAPPSKGGAAKPKTGGSKAPVGRGGAGGVGMAPGSMTGAKKQMMGMAALYGSLE